jgi:hypothetical protein
MRLKRGKEEGGKTGDCENEVIWDAQSGFGLEQCSFKQ